MAEWMIDLVALASANPALVVVAVALATFVLEDAATVGAALLAAEGVLPVPAVLAGLFIGITLGDMGLFGIGYLSKRWDWLRDRIGAHRLARGQTWLGERLVAAIFLARVTPGLRVPCYVASGYLGVPFVTFAGLAVVAVALWSAGAFTLVYFYGQVARASLGSFSWIAGFILLVAVLVWPHIFRLRSKR